MEPPKPEELLPRSRRVEKRLLRSFRASRVLHWDLPALALTQEGLSSRVGEERFAIREGMDNEFGPPSIGQSLHPFEREMDDDADYFYGEEILGSSTEDLLAIDGTGNELVLTLGDTTYEVVMALGDTANEVMLALGGIFLPSELDGGEDVHEIRLEGEGVTNEGHAVDGIFPARTPEIPDGGDAEELGNGYLAMSISHHVPTSETGGDNRDPPSNFSRGIGVAANETAGAATGMISLPEREVVPEGYIAAQEVELQHLQNGLLNLTIEEIFSLSNPDPVVKDGGFLRELEAACPRSQGLSTQGIFQEPEEEEEWDFLRSEVDEQENQGLTISEIFPPWNPGVVEIREDHHFTKAISSSIIEDPEMEECPDEALGEKCCADKLVDLQGFLPLTGENGGEQCITPFQVRAAADEQVGGAEDSVADIHSPTTLQHNINSVKLRVPRAFISVTAGDGEDHAPIKLETEDRKDLMFSKFLDSWKHVAHSEVFGQIAGSFDGAKMEKGAGMRPIGYRSIPTEKHHDYIPQSSEDATDSINDGNTCGNQPGVQPSCMVKNEKIGTILQLFEEEAEFTRNRVVDMKTTLRSRFADLEENYGDVVVGGTYPLWEI